MSFNINIIISKYNNYNYKVNNFIFRESNLCDLCENVDKNFLKKVFYAKNILGKDVKRYIYYF